MHRRDWLKWSGLGAGALGLPWVAARSLRPAPAAEPATTKPGMPPLKITGPLALLLDALIKSLPAPKVIVQAPPMVSCVCCTRS